jgi:hypothetical protein
MAEVTSDGDASRQEGGYDWLARPDTVRIWEDRFRVLHVAVNGEEFENVRPRQTFPLSGRAEYISFLDEEDKEVVLLGHPRKLDKESRLALEKALERVYYSARILRIDAITELMGVTRWEVQTDRGYAMFEVVDRSQHIRKLPDRRLIIMDADGNRFEVEDIARLDERSQSLIHSEV